MKQLLTLIMLVPFMGLTQWTQLGNSINGTTANDKLGSTHAIAIDSLGTTIAVGTPFNGTLFPYSGYAKVLDWNGSSWVQRGSDFLGTDSTYEGTGSAVDLSADGMAVAVSSPWGYNSLGYKCGNVRVFDWVGNSWVQRGATIEGEGSIFPTFEGDVFGTALQLSADGNYIVVGARANTPEVGVNQIAGHVRVYHWNSTTWEQLGQDIDGPLSLGTSEFGYAVSINDAGNRIVIGSRAFTGSVLSNQERGMAIALEYNGANWIQMGDTLLGGQAGDNTGAAVQMSSDGNTIAVSAPKANGFLGKTKVLDWNGSAWIQRGGDLIGINGAQSGTSIGLSDNSNIIALGEPWTNSALGATRIFKWNGTSWQQLGATLTLPGSNIEAFGSAVRLNSSGSKVIVGIPRNDDAGNDFGQVRVYDNPSILGIADATAIEQIKVYPNPTANEVQVKSELDILSYKLISLEGKTILSDNSGLGKEFIVDVSDLTTGVYLLLLQTTQKTNSLRIIKD